MPGDSHDPLETLREMLERANQQPGTYIESRRRATELVSMLSTSEKLILRQIVDGWSSRDMAEHHGVEIGVFESQRTRLFAKISAGSTLDAVRIGIYAGL